MSEQQIRISAQLYKLRDSAKRLLGDKYHSQMADLGNILQATADRDGKGVIQVATDVCTKRHLAGMDLILIMAAAVELVEPSS